MSIKYYKENKTGEEKVLRVNLDSKTEHPKPGTDPAKGEKITVVEVIFVKQGADGKVPIIAPGLIPVEGLDGGFGFNLTEITYQEFCHYVQGATDALWEICTDLGSPRDVPKDQLTEEVLTNGTLVDMQGNHTDETPQSQVN